MKKYEPNLDLRWSFGTPKRLELWAVFAGWPLQAEIDQLESSIAKLSEDIADISSQITKLSYLAHAALGDTDIS